LPLDGSAMLDDCRYRDIFSCVNTWFCSTKYNRRNNCFKGKNAWIYLDAASQKQPSVFSAVTTPWGHLRI